MTNRPDPAADVDAQLDEILQDPGTYYIQDPDSGDFIRYDMNAALQLLKPELKQLMVDERLSEVNDALECFDDIGESDSENYSTAYGYLERRQETLEQSLPQQPDQAGLGEGGKL